MYLRPRLLRCRSLKYECDKCGACCRQLIVEADELDVLREPRLIEAARHYAGRSVDEVVDELQSDVGKVLVIVCSSGCRFVGTDNQCTIYPTRVQMFVWRCRPVTSSAKRYGRPRVWNLWHRASRRAECVARPVLSNTWPVIGRWGRANRSIHPFVTSPTEPANCWQTRKPGRSAEKRPSAAMMAKLTSHVWSFDELFDEVLS